MWNFADEKEIPKPASNSPVVTPAVPKILETVRNRIYFYAEIERDNILRLIKELREKIDGLTWAAHADKWPGLPPIHLYIQSYGGGLLTGLSAMDNILTFREEVPIITVVNGYCASAATLLSIVGSQRLILENSYMLIHQLSSGMWGTYEELQDDKANVDSFMKTIYRIYNKHTTIPKKKLKEILKHDLWFDAKTCLKYGLVDEIIGIGKTKK